MTPIVNAEPRWYRGVDWRRTIARWIVLSIVGIPIVALQLFFLPFIGIAHCVEWAIKGPRWDRDVGIIGIWDDCWSWDKKVTRPFYKSFYKE